MPIMRTTFLVDGFNLYYSAIDASVELGGTSTKWLNLHSLCSSYLYLIDKTALLSEIYYFSALAIHLEAQDPGKVQRHKTYIECLKSVNVKIELSQFKKRPLWCHKCGNKVKSYEEKETDVAIAVKLIELLHTDELDAAVLVTGDTDLTPAIETAQNLFPQKKFIFAFPFGRKHIDLAKLAPGSFSIKPKQYDRHQFTDVVTLKDGTQVSKPTTW